MSWFEELFINEAKAAIDGSSGGSGSSGGEVWELISSGEVTEDVKDIIITADNNGNAFALKKGYWKVNTAGSTQNTTNLNCALRLQVATMAYQVLECVMILRPTASGTTIVFETYGDAAYAVARQTAALSTGMLANECFDGVNKLFLNGGNYGGWFGAGSTWELWGVRK